MTEAPLPTPKRTGRFLSPRKIARVAGREFVSTALTKGFLIGVFVVPAVLIVVMPLIIFLVEQAEPPVVRGRIAVIDRSGEVAPLLEQRLSTEAIAERRGEQAEAIAEKTQELVGDTPQGQQAAKSIQQAATANLPVIKVDTRDPTADPDAFKQQVRDAMRTEVPLDDPDAQRILGVAVIPENAVQRADGEQAFAGYELFVDKNIDARTVDEIQDSIGWSIREARYQLAGYDRTELEALRTVARTTQEVTETGTRESNLELSLLLPGAFMLLILISVLTGGQYLLTTTIEEKSSRVVEVLLSSVSPLELMTGKVLGQMLVGLALLVVYSGLGIATLVFIFSRLDLINPAEVAAMVVFFILAYFMFASLMAAAGAAVNELREAQSLMTPIMILAGIPYFLFLPVSMAPNAAYSVALSFLPPISPFMMMLRVASTDPPPAWQVLASIAIGVVGCVACIWFAAKVFRVGLLMYGKPPNLPTLIRWVRMA